MFKQVIFRFIPNARRVSIYQLNILPISLNKCMSCFVKVGRCA